VVDASGDGDIFASAGAAFDRDIDESSIHARMNTAFRCGGVDTARWLAARQADPKAYGELMRRASAEGVEVRFGATPVEGVVVCMTPKLSGYDCLKVADLTAVEIVSRRHMQAGIAWFRANVPGFERAWLLESAPQIGTRHSRRLRGEVRVTWADWKAGVRHSDAVGLCPGPSPDVPTLGIPYRCLVPAALDGLLAAGRNLSADPIAHNPLREVPECWVLGQAAGVAAAVAVQRRVALRDVPVAELQARLRRQGAVVDVPAAAEAAV
jgi:hypothetical protein